VHHLLNLGVARGCLIKNKKMGKEEAVYLEKEANASLMVTAEGHWR
jgi:hypothetical protein